MSSDTGHKLPEEFVISLVGCEVLFQVWEKPPSKTKLMEGKLLVYVSDHVIVGDQLPTRGFVVIATAGEYPNIRAYLLSHVQYIAPVQRKDKKRSDPFVFELANGGKVIVA